MMRKSWLSGAQVQYWDSAHPQILGIETIMPIDKPSTHTFSSDEARAVYRAIFERRDVRSQFLPEPIPDAVLARILEAAHHAPSVGFMQPWDFILIRDVAVRRRIHDNFLQSNRRAAEIYEGERRNLYGRLKLEGILDSPLNICVTCDHSRPTGDGVGKQSIPETDLYSAVCAVENLWLAARAESLGVGWVSIIDNKALAQTLGLPEHVTPVAYLCVGYVSHFEPRPELETVGWCSRHSLASLIHFEHWNGRDEKKATELLAAATSQP
jgi:5,6-dimethylbenzimidazole synthase